MKNVSNLSFCGQTNWREKRIRLIETENFQITIIIQLEIRMLQEFVVL